MRVVSLAAMTLAIVLSVSWMSIVLYPSARDFMRANPFWNGLRDFGAAFGAETAFDLDHLESGPEGAVLIAIPYLPYEDQELKQIASFVRGGGKLILLDDYGYGNQVLAALGLVLKFDGGPLLDPYLNYRNQWFPVVTDVTAELKGAGIRQLTLNYATALSILAPYETLARSSNLAFIDRNGNESWDQGEPRGPFAVIARAAVGRGMVVAISDPSILINTMVGRGDNEALLRQLISMAGQNPRVLLDTSHLTKVPLDSSKDVLELVREQMATPHSQVLLVATILLVTFMPAWRKGDSNGQGQ